MSGTLSLVAACGGMEGEGPEKVAVVEGALLTPQATWPLPKTSLLQPLTVIAQQTPRQLISSNNPESVYTHGILFSTLADPPVGTNRLDPAVIDRSSPPSASIVGVKNLDPTCPLGAVKEIGVYIAHILKSTAAGGYVGLYVTPTASTTLEVTGDLANGPFNTQQQTFVSHVVTRKYYFEPLSNKRTLSVTANAYTLVDIAGDDLYRDSSGNLVPYRGGYYDGRLNLKVASGCMYVHVVSQATKTAATGLPTTSTGARIFAKGNVAWPGWSGSGSFGTSAGVYPSDTVLGSQAFDLPGQGYARGYMIGAVAQAQTAIYRYGDSASINFGNYGNFYDQTFEVRNTGTACMKVRAEYVAYANVPSDQSPIYDIYNRLYAANPAGFPTMYWNAPLRYSSNGGTFSAVEPVILYPTTNTSTPNAVPPTIRHGIWESLVNPTFKWTIRIQTAVPGLIRMPTAVVFTSTSC